MERADQAEAIAIIDARAGRQVPVSVSQQERSKPRQQEARTALILYGSETGNAQDVAEEVGRTTERLRFNTVVQELDSTQLKDIVKSTIVIFVVSTAGQGEFPQNARRFWKTLLSSALKPGSLRRAHFSSFGIGDSSYPRFNVAHRMLCGRLAQLGANLFCERGEGNEQHAEGHSAGFRAWVVELRKQLEERYSLPAGVEPIADDVFVEPKWQLIVDNAAHDDYVDPAVSNPSNGAVILEDYIKTAVKPASPARDLVPIAGAYTAEILDNKRVTSSGHFQDVRLLDMRVNEHYTYGPGAVAVVYPKNFPDDVQEFIDLMAWQPIADLPLQLAPTTPFAPLTPSPLRHLALTSTPVTIRWLLETILDIMSIPRRTFFASLVHCLSKVHPDAEFQKTRLIELANPELIDELWDYTTRPKRTILEALMDFTAVKIPWQYALSVLPLMRGRQFSIASGGALIRDSEGRTKVELLVAIVEPPSPIIKWRKRYGVCTRYIATLQAGQQITLGLQQGYLDVQPDELDVPVVMIGPGTGVAPTRSMIHQRLAWAREHGRREAGAALKGDILVFGCRSESDDYFFVDEWTDLAASEGLTVLLAFSRDARHKKMYVQDQLRANASKVYEALCTRSGKVYVCGSSGNMPKGVREALLDVFVECGDDMDRDGAEYLDEMERTGRYKQETW